MADPFAEKQRKRFQYLKALYDATDGNPHAVLSMWELGDELGFSRPETENVYNYLDGEGLLQAQALGGAMGITHAGVVEVEQALSKPDKPTQHFPVNIIHNTGTIGAIQQDVQHSTQTVYFNEQQAQSVAGFLDQLKAELPKLNLSAEAQAEAGTQVATIDLQLKSAKPNSIIVGESLKTVRNLLEGVGGNLIAAGLLGQLHPLLVLLGFH